MITRDAIETCYAFFHQKLRVYEHSHMDWQRDDIEQAITDYTGQMSPELLARLARGREDFLQTHTHFEAELREAVEVMEKMI